MPKMALLSHKQIESCNCIDSPSQHRLEFSSEFVSIVLVSEEGLIRGLAQLRPMPPLTRNDANIKITFAAFTEKA